LFGHGVSSFVYAVNKGRAVEISEDNGGFWLEFWEKSEDEDPAPVKELIVETGKDDALLSVSTPAAAKAELHESMNVGGMMSMKPVERIDVPSGQSVQLKPGGYHVMLMDLTAPIDVGATVDLTLTFANGAKVTVKAPIRQP
jgi:copper(I)-binding protein